MEFLIIPSVINRVIAQVVQFLLCLAKNGKNFAFNLCTIWSAKIRAQNHFRPESVRIRLNYSIVVFLERLFNKTSADSSLPL